MGTLCVTRDGERRQICLQYPTQNYCNLRFSSTDETDEYIQLIKIFTFIGTVTFHVVAVLNTFTCTRVIRMHS